MEYLNATVVAGPDKVSSIDAKTLNALSDLILDPEFSQQVVEKLFPIVFQLTQNGLRRYLHKLKTKHKQASPKSKVALTLLDILKKTSKVKDLALDFFSEECCNLFSPIASQESLLLRNYKNTPDLRDIARIVYELLHAFPCEIVRGLFNFSAFYRLVFSDDESTRWYACRAVSKLLEMNDATSYLFFQNLNVASLYVQEFQDQPNRHVIEGQKLLVNEKLIQYGEYSRSIDVNIDNTDDFVDVFGIQLKTHGSSEHGVQFGKLVLTNSTKLNLRRIAAALLSKKPILLEGPAGSGKSTLFKEIARMTNRTTKDIVEIQLDDQMDSKTLLGSYVCSEVPGEFKWQPGSLTYAVTHGHWVIVEDIDRAPFEVLSALIPLFETNQLLLPTRNQILLAHRDFQLFATKASKTVNSGIKASTPSTSLLRNLFTHIQVQNLSRDELKEIAIHRFSQLNEKLVDMILDTYHALGSECCPVDISRAVPGRTFSSRDLFKWLHRVCHHAVLYVDKRDNSSADLFLTQNERENVLLECLDVFAAGMPNVELREAFASWLCTQWQLPAKQLESNYSTRRPILTQDSHSLQVGRVTINRSNSQMQLTGHDRQQQRFAEAGVSLRLLEQLAVSVKMNEPVLLVGETGTGKTAMVQELASLLDKRLVVLNMHVQSDSAELLGGYKPVELVHLARPVYTQFLHLFATQFSKKANEKFLAAVNTSFDNCKWKKFSRAMSTAVKMAFAKLRKQKLKLLEKEKSSEAVVNGNMKREYDHLPVGQGTNKRVKGDAQAKQAWIEFETQVALFERRRTQVENSFAFQFEEGVLIKSIQNGDWILLDEINLASNETLERLCPLLDNSTSSLSLTERGDVQHIQRHSEFRLFGTMNPATDVGKKDLPPQLRYRFTEVYSDEVTHVSDLELIAKNYLLDVPASATINGKHPIELAVNLYLESRSLAQQHKLVDGAKQRPQYSLRTFCRTLQVSRLFFTKCGFSIQRGMYEAFCMTFLTLLEPVSYLVLHKKIKSAFVKGIKLKELAAPPSNPGGRANKDKFVLIEKFWLLHGESEPKPATDPSLNFILTKSVVTYVCSLARCIAAHDYPILLQGPTSSGKTSMVSYLAARTGNRCVRINNHEHTDLQEYMGSYISDESGKLTFSEGILVQAVRHGYWIVLDELNLAPSEVLEALNRLLDDNRELFIPETQETITPHPNFMLFATQNPPGVYGGRKVLSRAFRNRFLELHVDEIPSEELEEILNRRCCLAPSFCKVLVNVLKDLQLHRSETNVFAGKDGFITPRDLLRWADRNPGSYMELAIEGYRLLGERVRVESEKEVVKNVLEKWCKVKLDEDSLYSFQLQLSGVEEMSSQLEGKSFDTIIEFVDQLVSQTDDKSRAGLGLQSIVWTKSMRRLFSLVQHCIAKKEPVLLVGDTGTGKTTVCQLLALYASRSLQILNCHQNSETADILGSLRPVRNKDQLSSKLNAYSLEFLHHYSAVTLQVLCSKEEHTDLSALKSCSSTELMQLVTKCYQKLQHQSKENTHDVKRKKLNCAKKASVQVEDSKYREHTYKLICELYSKHQALFEWQDGPLVTALRQGDFFLLDELSLAEDAVLERLNSVLEPSRTLVLAEKGGNQVEELVAHEAFRIMSTMNPGGDYGKRELSPALRNRFTEIWIPSITLREDLLSIVKSKFTSYMEESEGLLAIEELSVLLIDFITWFNQQAKRSLLSVLSLRDVLSWIHFICITVKSNILSEWQAYIHGAGLVILDGLGLGSGVSDLISSHLKQDSYALLQSQIPSTIREAVLQSNILLCLKDIPCESNYCKLENDLFGVDPFYIACGNQGISEVNYALSAPTTCKNLVRVLRAMQLKQPILLEGSPGVGKTTLIQALAVASGHKLVRINLSEQTDFADLMGSDLPMPVTDDDAADTQFIWSDGIFLDALKNGYWVLLDELNLASQSVLEGLNACLDHRATVYIPELDQSFDCPSTFRVFAAQNPLNQGGGRKGLPKSFLNRFTKVYVDSLKSEDMQFIASTMYPELKQYEDQMLNRMIQFNETLLHDIVVQRKYGLAGSPWEFNLRDVFRWCDLMMSEQNSVIGYHPNAFIDIIYVQRLRCEADRKQLRDTFENIFGLPVEQAQPLVKLTSSHIYVGDVELPRFTSPALHWRDQEFPSGLLQPLMHVARCVKYNWPVLLVGESNTGKSCCLKYLSHLCNKKLHVFSVSSSTDSTELLGCFEQKDHSTVHTKLRQEITTLSYQLISHLMLIVRRIDSDEKYLKAVMSLENSGNQLVTELHQNENNTSGMFENCITSIEAALLLLHADSEDLSKELKCFESIQEYYSTISQTSKKQQGFEWIDGTLVQAMEQGDWIILDNANLCNPTVLDRLNPLLEPNGELLINECGMVDGKPRIIKPHSDFRIFLVMDYRNGEISRAMRNRCIEICLLKPDQPTPCFDLSLDYQPRNMAALSDVLCEMNSIGLPGLHLPMCLCRIHCKLASILYEKYGPSGEIPSLTHLSRWSRAIKQRVCISVTESVFSVVRESFLQLYSCCGSNLKEVRAMVEEELIMMNSSDQLLSSDSNLFFHSFIRSLPDDGIDFINDDLKKHSMVLYSMLFAYHTQQNQNKNYHVELPLIVLSGKYDLNDSEFDLDQYAFHSVLHYMETTSNFSRDLRLQYLLHLSQFFDNQSIKLIVNFIQTQFDQQDNPLLQLVCSIQHSLLDGKTENSECFSTADALRLFCNAKVCASEEIYQMYLYLSRLENLQFIYFKHQYKLYKEDKFYKQQVDNDDYDETASYIVASYLSKDGSGDQASGIVLYLYPLFQAVDDFLVTVLRTIVPSLKENLLQVLQDLYTNINELFDLRNKMWTLTSISVKLNSIGFMNESSILLRWLFKCVIRMVDSIESSCLSLVLDKSNHLVYVLNRLNHFMNETLSDLLASYNKKFQRSDAVLVAHKRLKNTLWKKGGHVNAFINDTLFGVFKQVKLLDDCFQADSSKPISIQSILYSSQMNGVDSLLNVTCDMRKEVLNMLCAIESCNITNKSNLDESMVLLLEKRLKQFRIVDQSQQDVEMMDEEDVIAIATKQQQVNYSFMQLYPIFDAWCCKEEQRLIHCLVRILNSDNDLVVALNGLRSRIQHFINYSIELSSKSSFGLYHYQNLLYLLDSDESVEFIYSYLKNVISALFVALYTSQWKSHINHLNMISPELSTSSLVSSREDFVTNTAHIFEGLKFGEGSPRADDTVDIVSLNIFKLLHNTNIGVNHGYSCILPSKYDLYAKKQLSIRDRSVKKTQLNMLLSHLRLHQEDSEEKAIDNDLLTMWHTFESVLKCFIAGDSLNEMKACLFQNDWDGDGNAEICKAAVIEELSQTDDAKLSNNICSLAVPCLVAFITCKNENELMYKRMVNKGRVHVYLSLLQLHLITPSTCIDPASKSLNRLNLLNTINESLNYELMMRSIHYGLQGCGTMMDRRMLQVQSSLESNLKAMDELKQKVVYRSNDIKFESLFNVLNEFLTTIASVDRVMQLISSTESASLSASNEEEIFQDTCLKFISNLNTTYGVFPDIIFPFMFGLYELKCGIRLIAYGNLLKEQRANITVNSNVCNILLSYPSTCVDIHGEAQNNLVHSFTSLLEDKVTASFTDKRTVYKIKCDLLQVVFSRIQIAIHDGVDGYNADSFGTVNQLFQIFSTQWNEYRKEQQKLQEEREQSVKYKAKVHECLAVEQEQDEVFKKLFPDYYSMFNDIEQITNDAASVEDEYQQPETPADDDSVVHNEAISEGQIHVLVESFLNAFNNKSLSSEARMKCFADCYQAAGHFLSLGPIIHERRNVVYGGHLLALTSCISECVIPDEGQEVQLDLIDSLEIDDNSTRFLNLHLEPCVEEAILIEKPLSNLLVRLNQLMHSWPDNLILKQLNALTERIFSLPLSSPLMKILIGVELLLKKGTDWEKVAHKEISIEAELIPLSRLVIRWRKLELKSWPNLLNWRETVHHDQAKKFWFHLFDLTICHEFKSKSTDESDLDAVATRINCWSVVTCIEGSNWVFYPSKSVLKDDDTEASKFHKELFETLDQFIRTSTFGDYNARLELLRAFSSYLYLNNQFKQLKESTVNILINLVEYYMQYHSTIVNKLQSLKAPIQSKLKDHTKLSKWDDQTYYALKESAEKSHRILHKFSIEYDEVLNMPIYPLIEATLDSCLQNSGNHSTEEGTTSVLVQLSDEEIKSKSFINQIHCTKLQTGALEDCNISLEFYQLVQSYVNNDRINKISKLNSKIGNYLSKSKIFKDLLDLESAQAPLEINDVIVQRMHKLQQPNTSQMAKQLALRDLFSHLKLNSIVKSKIVLPQNLRILMALSNPTNSLKQAMNVFPSQGNSQSIMKQWQLSDKCYYKCVTQLQRMKLTTLGVYSGDLNRDHVNKMLLYGESLMVDMLQQRQLIYSLSTDYSSIIQALIDLKKLAEAESLVDSKSLWDILKVLRTNVCCLCTMIHEFYVVFQNLQSKNIKFDSSLSTHLSSIAASEAHNGIKQLYSKDNELYETIDNLFLNSLRLISEMKDILKKYFTPIPTAKDTQQLAMNGKILTLQDVSTIQSLFELVNDLNVNVSGICNRDYLPLTICSELKTILRDTMTYEAKFKSVVNLSSDVNEDEQVDFLQSFVSNTEEVITNSLLAVQFLYNIDPVVDEKVEEEELDYTKLQNHHDDILKIVQNLNLSKLVGCVRKFIDLFKSRAYKGNQFQMPTEQVLSNCCIIASQLYNMMYYMQSIVEVLIQHIVYFNYHICRLEFLLVRIFRTLLAHGFCKPPDYDENDDGNDNGDDPDKEFEGTGMGQGEGSKDVTDEIEDEEQLLGLKGEQPDDNQEKPDLNEKKGDDGMEMENDFDGDMYDVEKDEVNEEDKDDDDEKDEEGEELDREMGDLNDEQQVVDEKLWDDEDEDEEDNKEDEKFEKDAPMQGDNCDELRAKEDDDEEPAESNDLNNEPPKQPPDQQPEAQEEVNENTEDKYEDKHQDVPQYDDIDEEQGKLDELDQPEEEGEDLELPEDMDIDQGQDEGEEENREEDDAMSVDGGEPAQEEQAEAEKEDDASPDDDTAKQVSEELEQEQEENQEQDVDDGDEDQLTCMPPEQTAEDGGVADNQTGVDMGSDAMADQLNDEKDDRQQNQSDQQQQQSRADKNSNANDAEKDRPNSASGEQEQALDDAGSADWRDKQQNQEQQEGGDQQQDQQQSGDDGRANPWRRSGDASQHWNRRLKMISPEMQADQQPPATTTNSEDKEDVEMDVGNQEDHYKYDEGEKADNNTAQVLGPSANTEDIELPDLQEEQMIEEEPQDSKQQVREDDERNKESSSGEPKPNTDDSGQQPKSQKDTALPPGDNEAEDGDDDDDNMEIDEAEPSVPHDWEPGEVDTSIKVETNMDILNGKNVMEDELFCMIPRLRQEVQSHASTVEEISEGLKKWAHFAGETIDLSQRLCEQLRLLLEPTLASKLKGDYRTGKRINMRKVIPYIASQYKKDKIWLRRSKPSKREYQIVLAIDDSKSMQVSGELALKALTMISKALTQLEVGELAVVSFGEEVKLLHDLSNQFSDTTGANVVNQFTFEQEETNIQVGIEAITELLLCSQLSSSNCSNVEYRQLIFFISDGRFDSDVRENIQRLVRKAASKRILLVLLIVEDSSKEESIIDIKQVTYPKGKLKMSSYLDRYPFPYYIIIRDMVSLPETLADAMKQWFELSSS